ncbi:hypothetical protein BG842_25685 [Haladaptatus sp. W1]|uniref:hypothetical protein n=1 Tax=Haladaptatus sp. W1 TaxID=1897478 RepID=UPI00084987C5|nr:hypothetical protein [Haladaptatus sp. W1]ODR81859.1 hypothetical protein BG842_25665 [Haladaptatus sp. W1]ODR81863.1 hypothetical protein BG842_25685 [Haladaptatus sp. W1]
MEIPLAVSLTVPKTSITAVVLRLLVPILRSVRRVVSVGFIPVRCIVISGRFVRPVIDSSSTADVYEAVADRQARQD